MYLYIIDIYVYQFLVCFKLHVLTIFLTGLFISFSAEVRLDNIWLLLFKSYLMFRALCSFCVMNPVCLVCFIIVLGSKPGPRMLDKYTAVELCVQSFVLSVAWYFTFNNRIVFLIFNPLSRHRDPLLKWKTVLKKPSCTLVISAYWALEWNVHSVVPDQFLCCSSYSVWPQLPLTRSCFFSL